MNPRRTIRFLSLGFFTLILAFVCSPASGETQKAPVVLVLVERLTWEEVRQTPAFEEVFEKGSVANLSTAQGVAEPDPRTGHVLLGAGSRTDTSLLPENLPPQNSELSRAFTGPVSSIEPGLLGETLMEEGIKTAAIGERAGLVAMDRDGNLDDAYEFSEPLKGVEDALVDGAEFVVVEAGSPKKAAGIASSAQEAEAVVAIASLTSPEGAANLTPFVLAGAGEGLLYSPATRTRGLISSADVAPTLLAQLGIPPPPEMQGRAATGRTGSVGAAVRLGERISFVAEERFAVWLFVGIAALVGTLAAVLWKGRAGAAYALLFVAALPAGALVAAAPPVTNVPVVAFLTLFSAGALAGVFWKFGRTNVSRIGGVFLAVSAIVLADALSGGTLMKFSTLGYNPAYGTRFYGIGNEYAAFLAGSLTVGIGAAVHRGRLPLVSILGVGLVAVLALGLPTMGADVGGSLALGFGFGGTVGLVRGAGMKGLAFWSGGGLFLAAALFLLSGRLFPGVSHGSRTAAGETGLAEIFVRKLLLSLELLANPFLLAIFVFALALVFAGWRRVRGTALGAGMLGAGITALASGAINDSGILATIYVLSYPAVAALVILTTMSQELHTRTEGVRSFLVRGWDVFSGQGATQPEKETGVEGRKLFGLSLLTTLATLLALLLVFLVLFQGVKPAQAQEPTYDGQVVGGTPVPNDKYSFMAALRDIRYGNSAYGQQFCGGTLIDSNSVLTAAHCVVGTSARPLRVTVGRTVLSKSQGKTRKVSKIFVHPRYNDERLARDVAVLKLVRPVNSIEPIERAGANQDFLEKAGTSATVAGWGNTKAQPIYSFAGSKYPNRMREAQVPVRSDNYGASAYGRYFVKRLMVAAGKTGKDTCQGDSGGPIFKKTSSGYSQIGVTSFGYGCAARGYPGVYAEVNNYSIRKFISSAARR